MAKVLVACFSASGRTAGQAAKIADAVDGDLFTIAPKVKYSAADLNWMDQKSRSTREMQDKNCRPEMAADVPDLAPYDKIAIGFPIWWYTAPRIINTFLEGGDFSGREVYLFATSGGSDIQRSLRDLSQCYPEIHFVSGRLLNGSVEAGAVRKWLGVSGQEEK